MWMLFLCSPSLSLCVCVAVQLQQAGKVAEPKLSRRARQAGWRGQYVAERLSAAVLIYYDKIKL